MSEEQMRRALELISAAKTARKQFDTYVLLKRDASNRGETIQLGDPVSYRESEYHRLDVPIPEAARQHIFQLWRKEIAGRYNAIVRELNQLGAAHSFRLIEFSHSSGMPVA